MSKANTSRPVNPFLGGVGPEKSLHSIRGVVRRTFDRPLHSPHVATDIEYKRFVNLF
jgi:hypothetical protein